MIENIINQIKKNLTGSKENDIQLLLQSADEYKNHKNSKEIVKEIGRIIYDKLGKEFQERWGKVVEEELCFWDGKIFIIKNYINQKEFSKAEHNILEMLIKYGSFFKDDLISKYIYFNNMFEQLLFQLLFKKQYKNIKPCTYNYTELYFLYGYILFEKKNFKKAEAAFLEALKWNPLAIDVLFELCEIYKSTKKLSLLIDTIRKCHAIAYTSESLGKCFRNYGYYFTEIKDYDTSICSYLASAKYNYTDTIQSELFYISQKTGREIDLKKYDNNIIQRLLNKNGIKYGASDEVIAVCITIGTECFEKKNYQLALHSFKIYYEITRDEEVKATIKTLENFLADSKKDSNQRVNIAELMKLAEQGNANAQYNLGNHYIMGSSGLNQDDGKAFMWYSKAAQQGHTVAQYNVGNNYYYGRGVSQSYDKAVKWYCKSAEQEDVLAQFALGNCYKNGYGVKYDDIAAFGWYCKAAEKGHAAAQYNLGSCYFNGKGVQKDYYKAFMWHQKAADQGHSGSQVFIGNAYRIGDYVPKDFCKAIEWYKKAADQGNAYAHYKLGLCYYSGECGVKQNCKIAEKYFSEADRQGLEEAKDYLSLCSLFNQPSEEEFIGKRQVEEHCIISEIIEDTANKMVFYTDSLNTSGIACVTANIEDNHVIVYVPFGEGAYHKFDFGALDEKEDDSIPFDEYDLPF